MPPEMAPTRRLRRVAALTAGALLGSLSLALVLALLLPASLSVPLVLGLMALLVGALLLGLAIAWPSIRRAALLREAIDRSAVRYAVFGRDRTLLDHSPAHDLPGMGSGPVPAGTRLDDLLAASFRDDPLAATAIAGQIAAHEDDARAEYERNLPDGRIMQVSKRRLAGGEVARFSLDITSARARDLRARAIHEGVPAAIWHLDREGRTIAANQRLTDLLGGEVPATLTESGLQQLGSQGDGPFGLPTGREVEGVLPARGEAPERRVIVTTSPWLPGEKGGERAVLMLLDVTRLHAAQAQAVHFAWHDPLTGLPNRFRFQQAILQLTAARDGGSVLLVDLAGIRAVNDSLGQRAGDTILSEASRRLREQLRPGDAAFRLGGDEFAVIAAGLRTPQAAGAMAGRIQRALAAPLDLGGGGVPLRASIGHAHLPDDAEDAEGLHRAAALALAQAKRQGNGSVVAYDPELGERVARRLALREQLMAAVADGSFELAWQAQVDARTGTLRGAEALLRWPGGPGGPISPGEFLPEAEAAGLMPSIDAWVLEEALRQKAAWTAAGTGPEVVGINISPATLRDPEFPARVQATLVRYGVTPEALEVEIPEDVAARDIDAIAPVLNELIADGVRLSLDDFGGGSSALAHLLRLPVDQVKLDRSIVEGLPGGARERAILRAVATLARGMEIPLLAEGVETEAQREALLAEGCTVMQGWLFGRAVRAEELVAR
ncbi:bifunctional diguanylate cyclase/phosphodiesterase [Roseomonas sp. SSH11]|uniref:Bifunctional diguanylate cyclase/phosphodiesterase n=1 Tax=Pararoseomonas baculiformis TaxID=2820812 RepID=A0ABS4AG10_9PROT|nr:bifunctional diguanylate cyclase/phosphodiesterase [Pararoseomonas baculiformis]MBP0445962.1 bifunctional diguanylate cyclase/phosphodiesterase [Pararoseomonas baculiformis]